MIDCFHTHLNNGASNDLLPILGYVEVLSSKGENKDIMRDQYDSLSLTNAIGVCKLLGDGYFYGTNGQPVGKEYAFAGPWENPSYGIHINSGTVKVLAPYDSMQIDYSFKDVDGTFYLDSLKYIDNNVSKNQLSIECGTIIGDFSACSEYKYISLRSYSGKGVTGNLNSFNRTKAELPAYLLLINNQDLEGRVEDLLDKIAAVCDNGQLTIAVTGSPLITYSGVIADFEKQFIISNHTWSEA